MSNRVVALADAQGPMTDSAAAYLASVAEARAELVELYAHAIEPEPPDVELELDPLPAPAAPPAASTDTRLPEDVRKLGLARVAELRAELERRRVERVEAGQR